MQSVCGHARTQATTLSNVFLIHKEKNVSEQFKAQSLKAKLSSITY